MSPSKERPRRVISIFLLAMLNVSIMASLRNLPLVAEFGLSALFYFFVVVLGFLIPCALISAELATGWPKSGGIYIWVREALGDKWGFFAIWMQWVHNVAWYPVILSFVAATLAYVISPALAQNKFFILCVILVGFWGMTFLNYRGIKTSGWFSAIGVIAGTILPGLLIIALGISWVVGGHPLQTPISWAAVIPTFGEIGNLVFLAGLFLAFSGLEVSAGYASYVKDPQKNYPRGIILAALITLVVFMFGSLAVAFVIPKEEISLVSGLMESFQIFFAKYNFVWFLPIMALLLVIGAIAEVNSWIIGPVQGLLATSIHGNLPPYFQKVSARGVPTNLLLFQAGIMSVTSLIFLYMPNVSSAFWILTALSAQSYLIMYILMFIAALYLRYSKPHVPRAYKVPFQGKGIWMLCLLGILSSLFAIAIGFVPPTQLNIGSPTAYVFLLVGGLVAMCGIPLWIHAKRKPHWFARK
ncbi:MAG: amino acid permease [Verrucomicrobia bacterium]|nr:amino acid permease [Verrucomicrobiota bacterium]